MGNQQGGISLREGPGECSLQLVKVVDLKITDLAATPIGTLWADTDTDARRSPLAITQRHEPGVFLTDRPMGKRLRLAAGVQFMYAMLPAIKSVPVGTYAARRR